MVYLLKHVESGIQVILGVAQTYTIGNSPNNDIQINEGEIMCLAVIKTYRCSATIEDMGSKQGVFLNHTKVQEVADLKNGDIITFGGNDSKICFLIPEWKTTLEAVKTPEKEKCLSVLKELNIELADDYDETCTHFTVDTVSSRTVRDTNLLSALVDRKPLVNCQFWLDLHKKIEEAPVIPNIEKYSPRKHSDLRLYDMGKNVLTPNWSRKFLFEDCLCVFFHPKSFENLRQIIEKCGGVAIQFHNKMKFLSLLNTGEFKKTIFIKYHSKQLQTPQVQYVKKMVTEKGLEHFSMPVNDVYTCILLGSQTTMNAPNPAAKKTGTFAKPIIIIPSNTEKCVETRVGQPGQAKKTVNVGNKAGSPPSLSKKIVCKDSLDKQRSVQSKTFTKRPTATFRDVDTGKEITLKEITGRLVLNPFSGALNNAQDVPVDFDKLNKQYKHLKFRRVD